MLHQIIEIHYYERSMKKIIFTIFLSVLFVSVPSFANSQKAQKKSQPTHTWTILSLDAKFNKDEANFLRYAKNNSNVKTSPVAVFMGDSITDGWARKNPDFFKKNNYIGRGISGQVSSQMLVRFRRDVIDLKPKFVLILAGTNDIARNKGYISEENIAGNIISMCEIAKINGVEPIICSILPAAKYKWRPEIKSVEPIKKVNAILKKYADANSIAYLDYYSVLDDGNSGLSKAHSGDGVHPTKACYAIMEKMAKALIDKRSESK